MEHSPRQRRTRFAGTAILDMRQDVLANRMRIDNPSVTAPDNQISKPLRETQTRKIFAKRKCYFWFCLACKKHCCRCSSCSLRCCAPAHDLCIHARYKNLIGVLAHLGIKRELPPKNLTNIPINLSTTFPEPTQPFASGTGMSFNLLSLAALPVIPVLPAFRIGFDGLTPRDPKPSDSHCSRRHISWKIHSLWESLPWAKELQEN